MVFFVTPPEVWQVAAKDCKIAGRKGFYTIGNKAGTRPLDYIEYFNLTVEMPGICEMRLFLPLDLYRRTKRKVDMFLHHFHGPPSNYSTGLILTHNISK